MSASLRSPQKWCEGRLGFAALTRDQVVGVFLKFQLPQSSLDSCQLPLQDVLKLNEECIKRQETAAALPPVHHGVAANFTGGSTLTNAEWLGAIMPAP